MDVKKITAEYDRKTASDKKLAELERQAREGLRKWQAAEEFASRTGMTTAEVLISGFLEAYPDGKIPEADVRELTLSLLKHNYERVSKVAESAQMATNEEAGVGLKAVIPEFNKDRAEGIAKNIAAAEDLSEHSDQVGKEIENNSRSVVDDTIRENTKAHEQVGLEPRITRIYDGVGLSNGRVCEWCLERCGNDMTYQEAYEKGAFQRHPGCGCELYYKTGKRVQRQTDWTKNQWEEKHNDDIIKQRQETGIDGAFHKSAAFNSHADPMADAFGPGVVSHPEEIEAFKEECHKYGVEILLREHESINYEPSPALGKPGVLVISPDSSYSAWCHEICHMRDDKESGWDGALKVWDREEHVRREEKAYGIEIQMALDAGRPDIAELLQKNLDTEKERIYAAP